ncbi:hypothetical protein Anas_12910 [Armadillidium nasatum]|uniref:Uncharacterized protein n=1 Tax=Armadillidium nasatum TaxID=96803 RepID=A0A5N5SL30_9CRUS|nr:hypothetical protein Anas_12910 [Armadillidium nasatum]
MHTHQRDEHLFSSVLKTMATMRNIISECKKGVLSVIKVQADLTMIRNRSNNPSVLEFDATFNYFT